MNLQLPKKYLKSFYWRDYAVITTGLILYAIGLTGFLIPFEVVTGGLGGVSLLIKYATGIPLWASFIVFNAILLGMAWFVLGRQYVINSLFSTIGLSIALNITETYITQAFVQDETMSILIGAVLCGIGLGLVLSANSSTGGTDIIAAMITKYRYVSMGRILTYVDVLIIASSYLLFQSLEKIIVGLVIIVILYYAEIGRASCRERV